MASSEMNFRRIVILFILLEIAIVILAVYPNGLSVHALQTMTRYSGRLSLFLFSAIFLLQQNKTILYRWLSSHCYLLFAVVYGIHLLELFLFIILADVQLIPYRIAGGFLACLFVFVMPVIHYYHHNVKQLSKKKYTLAENVYTYYIWFIFFMTHLPRVQGKLPLSGGSYKEHVFLLGWVSLLLGYRISSLMKLKLR